MNLWVIFLTGLTVGGLTCLAVQGGLLASVITSREEIDGEKSESKKDPIYPTLAFLSTKLISYTILGFFLGAFGGAIGINSTVQTTMQFLAGIYMVLIALNLLDVHPIFRYVVIQPPKFLTRRIRNQSKSKELFAPALLGFMTIFIPCGTTLAMEVLAISSGSGLMGAAIMAVFILGTTPLFFGVGFATSILGNNFRAKFLKIAAIALIYLGLTSVNGAFVAIDSPLSLQSISQSIQKIIKPNVAEKLYDEEPVTQTPEITINSRGYYPSYIRVKMGLPVTLTLKSKDAYSCASAFRIPTLGISKNLQPNETYSFTFTPQQKGKIAFTCSMGMYSGTIEVI